MSIRIQGGHTQIGGSIVTDGLVLYLDAANVNSYSGTGSTWYDLSLSKNNGTLINSPTFNYGNGGKFLFDGVDDYISAGNLGNIGNYQTISVWFYSSSVVSYRNVLDMNYGNYVSANPGPRLEQTTGGVTYWVWSGDISNNNLRDIQSIPYNLVNNKWYNAVLTNNNGQMSFYLNGIAIQTNMSSSYGFVNTYGAISIGKGFYYESRCFEGNISVLSIYNRTLSENEVLQNYNAMKSRFGL